MLCFGAVAAANVLLFSPPTGGCFLAAKTLLLLQKLPPIFFIDKSKVVVTNLSASQMCTCHCKFAEINICIILDLGQPLSVKLYATYLPLGNWLKFNALAVNRKHAIRASES